MRKEDIKPISDLCKFIESKKGEDVTLFDLSEKQFIVDYSIAVTALNARHLYSLVGEIEKYLIENNRAIHHIEGNEASGWMIIDCYDMMINVFSKEERSRLDYDKLFVNNRE